jgi:hypothetical protein
MSNAKAPVLGHFGAAVAGLSALLLLSGFYLAKNYFRASIRAYGAQNSIINISLERIDKFTRTARTFYNLNRWICVRIGEGLQRALYAVI